MKYVWKCPECRRREERCENEGLFTCDYDDRVMHRDYRAQGIQVDRFALRVGGTRWSRREPMGPEAASDYNKERLTK